MSTQSNTPVTGGKEALTQEFNGKPLTASVFGYQRPDNLVKGKGIVRLCRSDIVYSSVQVLQEGGENNMHAHPAQDGIWIVLKGRVKFYGKGDAVLAELGPLQGIHIPRGFYYWFESASPEMLEILQVEAIDKSVKNERLNMTPPKDFATEIQRF
jgi:mannose-6-phosphate isomerase-like protein (cupin superfamily)